MPRWTFVYLTQTHCLFPREGSPFGGLRSADATWPPNHGNRVNLGSSSASCQGFQGSLHVAEQELDLVAERVALHLLHRRVFRILTGEKDQITVDTRLRITPRRLVENEFGSINSPSKKPVALYALRRLTHTCTLDKDFGARNTFLYWLVNWLFRKIAVSLMCARTQ